jgi:hypothetical protein
MRLSRTILFVSICLLVAVSCSNQSPEAPAKPPDEAAALAALKQVNQAQADFIRRTRRYAQGTDELIADRLLSGPPAAEGYSIRMLPSADAVSYTVEATPNDPAARHFFTDKSGIIRAETGKPATAASPEEK